MFYKDAGAAIEWLCRVLGFEVRLKVGGEDGSILHSELVYGDGLVLVYTADPELDSPASVGGVNTQALTVYVDDVDAHAARATASGAKLFRELADSRYSDEHHDRVYGVLDPEGHRWFIAQRLSPAP